MRDRRHAGPPDRIGRGPGRRGGLRRRARRRRHGRHVHAHRGPGGGRGADLRAGRHAGRAGGRPRAWRARPSRPWPSRPTAAPRSAARDPATSPAPPDRVATRRSSRQRGGALDRAAPLGRAARRRPRRAAQRRQEHALQPHRRGAHGHRRGPGPHDARPALRRTPSGTAAGSSSSTPAAWSSAPATPSRRRSRTRRAWRSPRPTSSSSWSTRRGRDAGRPGGRRAAAALPRARSSSRQQGRQRAAGGAGGRVHRLGWDELYALSALHGRGTGDLLDAVVWALPPESTAEIARKAAGGRGGRGRGGRGRLRDPPPAPPTPEEAAAAWDARVAADDVARGPIGIAIVGRPNVGKSRCSTRSWARSGPSSSDIPGTTRDAIDTTLDWHGQALRLIDTAGIRRRGKVAGGPAAETYSSLRALKAIGRADVADPGARRRRRADRPGRARGRLRRRGGQGPRRRRQQVGPR